MSERRWEIDSLKLCEGRAAELRAKISAWERSSREWLDLNAALQRENEELRSKLAEAEKKLAFILPKYNAQATSHNEKQAALLARAEAAEARVKELLVEEKR